MELKCLKIDDYSGKNLFETDKYEFYRLCYTYPLIIFAKDSCICFFGEVIKLDPKEILLLSVMIEHNTKKLKTGKPRGISCQTLCKRIEYKLKAEKDESYYNKRLTQYKSDITTKIKEVFEIQKDTYKIVVEQDNEKILFKGIDVELNSPYYNFDFSTILEQLFYGKRIGYNKKYYTDFAFSYKNETFEAGETK